MSYKLGIVGREFTSKAGQGGIKIKTNASHQTCHKKPKAINHPHDIQMMAMFTFITLYLVFKVINWI